MALEHARTDDRDLIGRIIPGGLRVMERAGVSPQGPLYEAEDPEGRRVILLILPAQASWQEPAGVRSLRFASQIRHPNVAGVYALGSLEDGSTYVVLEQVIGDPLPQLLSERITLPIGEVLDLTIQVAAGLEALHHGGLVHGSVSPGTIVVTRAPYGKSLVKLVGFSLDSDGQPATRPDDGNVDYASPERLAGGPPDVRGDVFSAGAVFHYLLTGSPPPREPPIDKVPRIARPVLERALAPRTAERFRTMTEFREAVEALAAATVTPPDTVVARRILGRALAAGVVVLASGVLLAPVWRRMENAWGGTSAVAPLPAPAPSAAADSAATASGAEAPPGRARLAEPRRSTEAGRIPAEPRDRPPPVGPTGNRPMDTGNEAPEAVGYMAQPRSSDLSPEMVEQGPPPSSQRPRPTPAIAPNPPPANPPRPLAILQEDPGLRLAIGDVTRVGLADAVFETRLGVLVLQLAPDGLSVPSASYNLQRLYLAYSAATDHQGDTVTLELRRNGDVVGWFTREGLRYASADGGRR
jgi:serine/threonine-protein kinase